MNDRRMISRRITDSAKFLRMPLTSQALYFHLILHADDDGIVEAFSVLRSVGAAEDDLRVLVGKGFVVVLDENFVTYIPDWLEHNTVRPDRKKDSVYQKLLIQVLPDVTLKPSKTDKNICMSDSQQPSVRQVSDKCQQNDGISKVKLSQVKSSKEKKYIVEQSPTSYPFQEIIDYLNQKTGKKFKSGSKANQKHIKARFSEGFTLEDFKRVIDLKCEEWSGSQMEMYLRPETLFGSKFDSYLNACPASKHQVQEQEEIEASVDYSQMDRRW